MLYLNWKLTLLFIAARTGDRLTVRMISQRFRKSSRLIQQSMGEITHVVQEAIEASAWSRYSAHRTWNPAPSIR